MSETMKREDISLREGGLTVNGIRVEPVRHEKTSSAVDSAHEELQMAKANLPILTRG